MNRILTRGLLLSIATLCACTGAGVDAGECSPDPDTLTASGAYTGIAVCPNGSERTLDMLMYQEPGDDDITGTLSLDWGVRYQDGLFDVTVAHVVRTQISDTEIDDDGVVAGRLLTETIQGTASAPDFSFALTADQTTPRPNAWQGTISQVNNQNEPVTTCDAVLARLGTELPELPEATTDAGAE